MNNKCKAALIAAGVFTAAFTISSAVINRKITEIAISRRPPSIYEKAGEIFQSKFMKDCDLAMLKEFSDALQAKPTKDVEIINRDGMRLAGHLYEAEHPKRIILAMHGWRSSWSFDFGAISDYLHDTDSSVLYAEQRGQNASDGEYMGFGVLERYDCLDWLQYIRDEISAELPVYLAGISMGATTVLMASGLGLPDYVHGIIADCGFTSPKAIWTHIVRNELHLTEKLIYPTAKRICSDEAHFDSESVSTVEAMKVNKTPVLFVHGLDDRFVPVAMTVENYAYCTAPKDIFIVPGAGHGASFLRDPDGYKQKTEAFFAAFD